MFKRIIIFIPGILAAYPYKSPPPEIDASEQRRMVDSIKSEEEKKARLDSEYKGMLAVSTENCLAKERRLQECVAEIGQYRQVIDNVMTPPNWDSLSATEKRAQAIRTKTEIVRGLASQKHVEMLFKSPELQRFAKTPIDSFMAGEKAKVKSRYPQDSLRKTYQANYSEFFKGKTSKGFSIIASTDSLFLDSVFKVMEDGRPAKNPGSPEFPVGALWQKCGPACVGEFAASEIDSLKLGSHTRTLRSPFGYARIRFDTLETTPPIPFEKALLYLSTIEVNAAMFRKTTLSQAKEYYAEHLEDFESPDTLRIRAWLMPPLARAGKTVRKIIKPNGIPLNRNLADTVNVRPMQLTQFDLPQPVSDFIYSRGKAGGYDVVIFEEGLWALKILSVTPAQGVLMQKFEAVKDRIMRRLDSAAQAEARKQSFKSAEAKIAYSIQNVLFNAYSEYLSKTDSRLSGTKLKPIPNITEGKKPSTADSLAFEERFQYQERLRQIQTENREAWLDGSVDYFIP